MKSKITVTLTVDSDDADGLAWELEKFLEMSADEYPFQIHTERLPPAAGDEARERSQ